MHACQPRKRRDLPSTTEVAQASFDSDVFLSPITMGAVCRSPWGHVLLCLPLSLGCSPLFQLALALAATVLAKLERGARS